MRTIIKEKIGLEKCLKWSFVGIGISTNNVDYVIPIHLSICASIVKRIDLYTQ